MAIVELGGTRVAYRVEGEGPGLVLVHGTGGNAETNWGHLVQELARHWPVVRPDYSGSGETRDTGGELSAERLAAEVVAAAEAAGAVPFDLVGFSLGAAVATKIAADYPHLVHRVVLLGAFLDGAGPRAADAVRPLERSDPQRSPGHGAFRAADRLQPNFLGESRP
ncbi:alpha/beta fold hydrolase [Xanthobacter variabilis]|uniref:alpha/beta fold hydrolase n=1 Tax=Xanthobacter variabilis TaxID=3119932 RepID=UPI00374F5083